MKVHEARFVAVVENHTLDGDKTITLMKHKNIYVIVVKVTCMDGAITVLII